jgi:hypothetical protein
MASSFNEPREVVDNPPDEPPLAIGEVTELILLPSPEPGSPAHVRSPRLANPTQAVSLAKQVVLNPLDSSFITTTLND